MRSVSERERREADLFLADLMGGPRRRRTQAPHPLAEARRALGAQVVDQEAAEVGPDCDEEVRHLKVDRTAADEAGDRADENSARTDDV